MALRESVEWMAYQAIENAAVEHQQRRVFRRTNTTASDAPGSPQLNNKGLTKSASCFDGGFAPRASSYPQMGQARVPEDLPNKMHISRSSSNFPRGNHGNDVDQSLLAGEQSEQGVMTNVKKRLSDNFEHYSSIFHEVALPILFRKGNRERSRSRSREQKRDQKKENDLNSNMSSCKLGVTADRVTEEDYVLVENIELHRMDGFVFSSRREVGKGHNFIPVHLSSPSWCDKCGDFIWGVSKQCLKCTHCEYTCHHKCREAVALDCASVSAEGRSSEKPAISRSAQLETSLSEPEQTSLSEPDPTSLSQPDQGQADDADSGYHTGSSTLQSRAQAVRRPPGDWTLTREDLRRRIETFNHNSHGLIMSLQQETNTFQGFIRVHMNLIRPINMSLSLRPPSIYDMIGQEDEGLQEEIVETDVDTQITSFYLPKDTTKVIHINCDTTAQEVIKTLLSKFKITDNPRKFALYEKICSEKATMRRLEDEECPLPLVLCWTQEGLEGLDRRKYILQENDTGEIMWEAFSLPELENFLKILNREEEEYVEQVKGKYRMLKIHMQRRLAELRPEEGAAGNEKPRQPVFV